MELTNTAQDYNEPIILPGVLDDYYFTKEYEEVSSLPSISDNIQIPPEQSYDFEPEVIVDDMLSPSSCLSLTVVPDYPLISIKNLISRSMQITYKVVFSTVVLNLIKLFF